MSKTCEERLGEIQRGLARVNPMQRSSPETSEARGIPWDHVL